MVKRFDVHLVALSADGATARPCVVLSPDEMNRYLPTVIVAPLTTRQRDFPTRVGISFKFKLGQIALEQIGVVDKSRLVRQLGKVGEGTRREVLAVLAEMFAE
jgi:mRNA interferase MazF